MQKPNFRYVKKLLKVTQLILSCVIKKKILLLKFS